MEFNSGVSMILPDSINLIENDFDDEDIIHEQTNQNEIVELIMAAFQDHDEPSDGEDDDDDESSNTSSSSHQSLDEQLMLNIINNNNNNTNEQYVQQQNELLHHNHSHQQTTLFPTPTISTSSSLVPLNNIHTFQNNNRSSSNTPTTNFHYAPTIDITDPQQTQYFYQTLSTNLNETQNQLNKLRILCSVKDRKASQLQNHCEEYREKYENDTRELKQKLELSEKSKYDWEQRYQLNNTQCKELIETNNQLHQTIKDSELQLEAVKTQFEKKLSDSESLIESLHRKINELQHFESIGRSQQDYELVLSTSCEKHEQEIISSNEKLKNIQINLQEKTTEADELRVQLEIANKNNEKTIFERMKTINHLNEQLHDCQRKYTDLLTKTSLETINQTEIKRQLTHITEDKEKLESKCQELQSQLRTLRERVNENDDEDEVNNAIFSIKSVPIDDHDCIENSVPDESIINENILLKERINEYVVKEKQLREINEELKHRIIEYEYSSKRHDSTSSSSSNETVITTSFHMEQIRKLTNQIETLQRDYTDLQEKYEYEKQELNTMLEQLREDVSDVDKTKQLYMDVCQEKNSIEDTLKSKFEYELKLKLDNLHQILEKEYNEKFLLYNHNQEKFEQDKQIIIRKYNHDFEQQSKEFHQEIDRIKVNYEKQILELNNELDRLRINDDTKNRLEYTEKEFEQLKQDYYNLNIKQSELLKTCSTLENENENLLNSIEKLEHEKFQLTETFENEIKQLKEHHKHELLSTHQQTDPNPIDLDDDIQSLQLRINNYENVITQYEEYRVKLENNLQKLTQQRDTYKIELRLTKEMLTNKENDYNQFKLHFDQGNQHLQTHQEQFRQYETTINDLQRQIKQYELQTQELNQTRRVAIIQDTELDNREKLISVDAEKRQLEQRLQEANHALDLADSHLKQEIEKIKTSLEQEYKRRYERDQKQHQHDLHQLRQQLTNEFNKQQSTSSSINLPNQEIEEIKKMYRIEIDRLYHENIEVNQHQSKLIDAHQKQMQLMKKELDDGYNNVINEFQREQTRLQIRCDQLKQQLNDAQLTIEQLKLNLNQLKTNHYEEISRIQETYNNENRNRQDNLQNRVENLIQLLEQSNDALNEERTFNAKQDNEYQHTINSLQNKVSDMIKQHTKSMNEIKRELHQERLTNQNRTAPRPKSVPEFPSTDLSSNEIKSDYITTVEKLRELFTNEIIALLRLTCKMIFDVHHRVTVANYMDNLDISMKKQIQNELLRSRNSMIKEIRGEIFEKMTHALRSQGVPDKIIDMHIFEFDRLLSQMVQDCLNSFPTPSSPKLNSSTLSFQITSQRQQTPSVILNSSLTNQSTIPFKKSIECLYITPTINKQPAPLAPHCRPLVDNNRRPKSASNILSASQKSKSSLCLSSNTHKYQRSKNKNSHIKMHRSEDDLIVATQRNQQQKIDLDKHNNTLPLYENEKQYQQSNVRTLKKQFEQKTNFLSDHSRTPDIHYVTTRIINNDKQEEDDDDKLSWPQEPISIISSTQTSGIKKFVRNSLKLFITQPQQHKRIGK